MYIDFYFNKAISYLIISLLYYYYLIYFLLKKDNVSAFSLKSFKNIKFCLLHFIITIIKFKIQIFLIYSFLKKLFI